MGALKIGALWMAGWIGGSSVIGTSSNSYSMGITGIWYVGEIAIGCVLFALVMAEPVKRVSEVLQNITFPEHREKSVSAISVKTRLCAIHGKDKTVFRNIHIAGLIAGPVAAVAGKAENFSL